MLDFIENLQRKLQRPLPGQAAQLLMAHAIRQQYEGVPVGARQAGVMAVLFPKDEAWHLLLIQRNPNDRDSHGGQISFPGGKAEPGDASMLETALRETEEEVGILRSEIKVLGGLSELYIPVSNFQVHPFVGYLERQPAYFLQLEEVDSVLEVPFSHFRNPATKRQANIPVSSVLTLRNVPYYDVGGQVLWGATAMMISELVEVAGG